MHPYRKIIILGAPRSGTNMLRDVLCSLNGVSTWPCDEINYIWRHGNVRYPSDEIPAFRAIEKVKLYIRNQFDWVARHNKSHTVVEKTCANSLRVPFVDRVVPDAKYVFIYRDGVDVTGSARIRWTAGLNVRYLLEKVRFVPAADIPYYGLRYFWSQTYRLFSRQGRVASWGPRFDGLEELLATHSLNEVCALQWQRCVDKAEEDLSHISADRVVRVRYESFVEHPEVELSRILSALGVRADSSEISAAVADVSSDSVGKGRNALSLSEMATLESLIGTTMERLGYGQSGDKDTPLV